MFLTEASVDFSDVRGRCTVVYSEEMNKDRDMDFTSGEDKFYFSEVWCYLLLHNSKIRVWGTHRDHENLLLITGVPYYASRKILGEHIVAALSVRQSHSCPAHNFIWSRISKQFYRNDHHVETTCRAQHLGPYYEGQGHSATLQQNRVRPITLLFEVRFRKYFTETITILRRRAARNIWVATLKVKVTAWLCSKIVSGQ